MNENFKIENDLLNIVNLIKTEYRDVPFDKGLPLLRIKMNKLADKYNTTGAEMWKLLFDLHSDKFN